MQLENNTGLTVSSIFMESFDRVLNKSTEMEINKGVPKLTEPPIIDFSNSVIQLNILSHYFVSTSNVNYTVESSVSSEFNGKNTTPLPLFLNGYQFIKIPNKVDVDIRRYIGKRQLSKIHSNEDVAIELCLLFLSNLSDTYFRMLGIGFDLNESNQGGWKNLSSEKLRSQFNDKMTYKNIINVLFEGTSKGPMIECDGKDAFGQKCFGYRLAERYRMKGVSKYEIKTDYVRKMQQQKSDKRLKDVLSNSICSSLIEMYPLSSLPNYTEMFEYGKVLAKGGYITKKEKLLTFMNKNGRNYWKNPDERSFLEDNMSIYSYLTEGGLLIPSPGGDRSGGRVVDSFTLMPSWQRNMLKIEGEQIQTVDFSCLHPNLCISNYGGNKKYLTHDYVSTMTGIDKKLIKKDHLSFFNKKYEDMIKSPLWAYYFQHEPEMLGNIIREKGNGKFGHKETSRNLFKKEVNIMTDVYTVLREKGIPAGYVYDALFCKISDAQEVKRIMDEVAIHHGVFTTAKIEI